MEKKCEACSGSGQINFFKGVSRFLLSTDECPVCAGLGYVFTESDHRSQPESKEEPEPPDDLPPNSGPGPE